MALQRRYIHAKRRLHALGPLTVVVTLGVLLGATEALAQISVEVSPLRVELQAGPGSTTTQGVTLKNGGSDPVRIRATLSDWDLSRDGAPQFETTLPDGRFSATRWVRLAPPELVVEPGREATVRFNLTVPPGTPPGGYRTGILFEFAPASGDATIGGRAVAFKSRVATLIYVNIGQPAVDAELTDLTVRTNQAGTQVIATLKNTSRRSVRTKGTMVLFDDAGKAVRQVTVPDVPLLPESEREVAIAAVDGEKHPQLPPGTYRVEVRIDVGLPAVIVGETTLKVGR
jgi:P pilus assembly chaperone PapD